MGKHGEEQPEVQPLAKVGLLQDRLGRMGHLHAHHIWGVLQGWGCILVPGAAGFSWLGGKQPGKAGVGLAAGNAAPATELPRGMVCVGFPVCITCHTAFPFSPAL